MPAESVFPAQPVSIGGARVFVAPYQFITDDDDNLRIVSVNSKTGVTLTIQGYRIDRAGVKVPFTYTHTPNTDRSVKTESFKFGAGALVSLNVQAAAGSPLVGQSFVIVQLIRGLSAATIVLGTLLQGYVTTTQGLGWPGSPIVSSTAGEPLVRNVAGTIPAAGVDIVEAVPAGARWELVSHFVVFTASAAVINRLMSYVTRATSNPTRLMAGNASVAASETWSLQWGPNLPLANDGGFFIAEAPLPDRTIMAAGDTFGTFTPNMQAGDHFSFNLYVVREWLEVS